MEDIRILAVGEFVPARLKESRRRRPNEPPVGSLPANRAAATVNEMFFPLAVVFVVGPGARTAFAAPMAILPSTGSGIAPFQMKQPKKGRLDEQYQLAGDAVLIAPVSRQFPCKQGILQGKGKFGG